MEKGTPIKRRLIPSLVLLLVIAITIGLFYFYRHYPDRIEQLQRYGYLGAFLITLTFNATVVLPAGSILMVIALGAGAQSTQSAILIGLVGGAGATIGEITGYMAGYSGRVVMEKSKLYNRVVGWMKKWGALTIFGLALVPLFFDLAGIAAGVLRFPLWKFLLTCWLGRTLLYIGAALAGAWGWETVLPYLG